MTSGRNYQRQETSQKMKAELSTLLNFIWKEGVVVEGKEDPYLVGLFPQKRDGRVNFLYYNTNRTTKLYSSPITTIICLLRPSFLSQYHRRSEPRTSSKKTATTLNPKTAMDGVVEKEDLRLPSFLFFFFFTTTHASPPLAFHVDVFYYFFSASQSSVGHFLHFL